MQASTTKSPRLAIFGALRFPAGIAIHKWIVIGEPRLLLAVGIRDVDLVVLDIVTQSTEKPLGRRR
jgi:hypothetical protein